MHCICVVFFRLEREPRAERSIRAPGSHAREEERGRAREGATVAMVAKGVDGETLLTFPLPGEQVYVRYFKLLRIFRA